MLHSLFGSVSTQHFAEAFVGLTSCNRYRFMAYAKPLGRAPRCQRYPLGYECR